MDDLALREAGPEPRRENFGPLDDYLHAWHLWRAICRDTYRRPDELEASMEAMCWRLGIPYEAPE